MKTKISDQLWLNFLNFGLTEMFAFDLASRSVITSLLRSRSMPKIRSDTIYIVRNPYDKPRYRVDTPFELISVSAEENKPFQFLYQFAHEMGHLTSLAWLRWGALGRHLWIEEALCGAYSIYCMRQAREVIQLNEGARLYLSDYIDKCYAETEAKAIDAIWFTKNASTLAAEKRLTEAIKPLSRLIADEFPNGDFVSDNMALANTSLNADLKTYLQKWSLLSNNERSVPKFLIDRLGL